MATITTSEFAEIIDANPRTARKFLRFDARERGIEIPGKGSRWAIEKRDIRGLQKRFKEWDAAQKEMRAAKLQEIADAAKTESDSDS